MTAAELLPTLQSAGITLSLTDRGTLRYQGDESAVSHWLPEIRTHKPALIALLTQAANDAPGDPPPLSPADQAAIEESIVERASILEFDAGMDRQQAEIAAQSAMRVYQALVTLPDGSSPRWITLLAPGCTMVEARATLAHQFGLERVLEVVEHSGGMTP